jgi:hypothetical protein
MSTQVSRVYTNENPSIAAIKTVIGEPRLAPENLNRVSLHPADPIDAVKALLRTPKPAKD